MRIMGSNFGPRPAFQYQVHNKIYKISSHIHQYAELIFMLEGEARLTTDGKEEMMRAGDAAFIFPFQTHSITSKDKNKIAMYLFSPAMLSDFMKNYEGKVGESARFVPSESTRAVLFDKIFENDDLPLYSVKGFLYLALNDYLIKTPLKDSLSGVGVVSKVITYMNEHYSEDISLETVASAIGYSANYLSHCIRRLYGLNFCSALACLRIERARYILTSTDKSITEICYECGFGSERTFLRQFKSVMGSTPSVYREKYFTGETEPPKIKYW